MQFLLYIIEGGMFYNIVYTPAVFALLLKNLKSAIQEKIIECTFLILPLLIILND